MLCGPGERCVWSLPHRKEESVYIQEKNLVKVPEQKQGDGSAVMSKMNCNKIFDDRDL